MPRKQKNDQLHCLSTKLLSVPAIPNLFHTDTFIRFFYQIVVFHFCQPTHRKVSCLSRNLSIFSRFFLNG